MNEQIKLKSFKEEIEQIASENPGVAIHVARTDLARKFTIDLQPTLVKPEIKSELADSLTRTSALRISIAGQVQANVGEVLREVVARISQNDDFVGIRVLPDGTVKM